MCFHHNFIFINVFRNITSMRLIVNFIVASNVVIFTYTWFFCSIKPYTHILGILQNFVIILCGMSSRDVIHLLFLLKFLKFLKLFKTRVLDENLTKNNILSCNLFFMSLVTSKMANMHIWLIFGAKPKFQIMQEGMHAQNFFHENSVNLLFGGCIH